MIRLIGCDKIIGGRFPARRIPDSKVPGANMGPTWVLSAPDWPHVGPRNIAIRVKMHGNKANARAVMSGVSALAGWAMALHTLTQTKRYPFEKFLWNFILIMHTFQVSVSWYSKVSLLIWCRLLKHFVNFVNSLWPSDVIWWHGSRSALAQVMACCLKAPSHYLNHCWLMISGVLWHSPDSNFTENTQDIYLWNEFEIH